MVAVPAFLDWVTGYPSIWCKVSAGGMRAFPELAWKSVDSAKRIVLPNVGGSPPVHWGPNREKRWGQVGLSLPRCWSWISAFFGPCLSWAPDLLPQPGSRTASSLAPGTHTAAVLGQLPGGPQWDVSASVIARTSILKRFSFFPIRSVFLENRS